MPPAPPPRRMRPMSVGSGLFAYLSVAGMSGLLVAGLALPVVGTSANMAKQGVEFFEDLPSDLDTGSTSQQSRVLYSDGSLMATFYYENRINIPLTQVSQHMQDAIIAIEDWRFYDHAGTDAMGITRAAVNNALGRDTQGASTLTQQWVRNVLLDQARAAGDEEEVARQLQPNTGRKIREIRMAVAAEKQFTKKEILENYLNIAAFGSNQYGVQTASQRYFSKNASQLTIAEAALLAGLVQQPTRFNPLKHPAASQKRRNVVLAEMLRRGYVTQAQHDAAAKIPIATMLKPKVMPNGCVQAKSAAFFCDYVTRVIASDPAFGADAESRRRLLYRGGLTIKTTLNRKMQTDAQATIQKYGAAADSPGVGMAMTTVEPGTGRILVMAQNRAFDPSVKKSKTTTSINYNVDAAYGGGQGFQTGSTYKPFTLATWLSSGHSLNEVVNANTQTYRMSTFNVGSCSTGNLVGTYRPYNAEGHGAGFITAYEASYNSVNTAYVNMASKLDLCAIKDTATKLGVHQGNGDPVDHNPASVLGTNLIAPVTMAGAFATFAADGRFCKPIAFNEITRPGGEKLKLPSAGCSQVLEPDVAAGVNAALQPVLTKGTGRRIGGIGRPAAGKTGTTNDSMETWFVGYTASQMSTAVWVGTPDPRPRTVNGRRIGGRYYGRVYGATVAGTAWGDFMRKAAQGMPVKNFNKGSGKVDLVERVPVPDVSGMSRQEAFSVLNSAGFNPYRADTVFSNSISPGRVVRTSPRGGRRAERGAPVGVLISAGPRPEPAPEPTPQPSDTPSAKPTSIFPSNEPTRSQPQPPKRGGGATPAPTN